MSWQPPSKPPLRFVPRRSAWGEAPTRGVWLTVLGVVFLLGLASWLAR